MPWDMDFIHLRHPQTTQIDSPRLHDTLAIPFDCQRFLLFSALFGDFVAETATVLGEIPWLPWCRHKEKWMRQSALATLSEQKLLKKKNFREWWVFWKVFLYFTWFFKETWITLCWCFEKRYRGIAIWKRFILSLFGNSPRVTICSYCVTQLLCCSRRWKT